LYATYANANLTIEQRHPRRPRPWRRRRFDRVSWCVLLLQINITVRLGFAAWLAAQALAQGLPFLRAMLDAFAGGPAVFVHISLYQTNGAPRFRRPDTLDAMEGTQTLSLWRAPSLRNIRCACPTWQCAHTEMHRRATRSTTSVWS